MSSVSPAPVTGPVLALETATPLGSVAIGEAGRLCLEIVVGIEIRHSEALLPAVAFALDRVGLVPADLRAIVVGAGPGSFTGVRIAAATAKGLRHALDIPLLAYPSLAALAAGAAAGERAVCALFDARRDEVYAACYRFPGNRRIVTELEPVALSIEEAFRRVRDWSPLFVGDGALKHAALLTAGGGEVGASPQAVPRASSLLWLAGLDGGDSGSIASPAAWQPAYVRPPGATPPTR